MIAIQKLQKRTLTAIFIAGRSWQGAGQHFLQGLSWCRHT